MRHAGKRVSLGFAMAALMSGGFIAPAGKERPHFHQSRADRERYLERAAAKRARKNAKRLKDSQK